MAPSFSYAESCETHIRIDPFEYLVLECAITRLRKGLGSSPKIMLQDG